MKVIGLFSLYLAVINVATFATYAKDKAASRNNQWRVEESTLHLLALAGGWPSAILAQQALHHKTRKVGFQRAFAATVALNCIAVVGILAAL